MVDLYTYIKQDLKKIFNESCIIISDIDQAEQIAKHVAFGDTYNIIFEASYLKNRFFTILKGYRNDVCIINCDSNINRFKKDVDESYGLIVCDNVSKCKDLDQLNYIKSNKILIC